MFKRKKLLIADIIFGGVIFYLFIAMVLAQVKVANSNDIGEKISANLFFVFVIYIDAVLGIVWAIVHFRLKKKHSRIYGSIQ